MENLRNVRPKCVSFFDTVLFCAVLPILKYRKNSWDLSRWFPICASRCAPEACGRFCGSMRLAKALAEASGDPRQDLKRCSRKHRGSTCQEILAEGSASRCFEVPTKRKLVFAEALRKLAGGRVVVSKEINKE